MSIQYIHGLLFRSVLHGIQPCTMDCVYDNETKEITLSDGRKLHWEDCHVVGCRSAIEIEVRPAEEPAIEEALTHANRYGYSDVHPYEIIRKVSDRTMDIRPMDYAQDPSWKPEFDIGGFLAHCKNQQDQKWFITSAPERPLVRIRLQKNGDWKDKHGNRYVLSSRAIRFYDYNF